MTREPHIPLFLWIATALLVHVTGGEGVQRVADVIGDRLEVQRFADSVRRHVLSSNRPTIEVALLDGDKAEPRPEDEAKPDEQDPDEQAKPSEEPSPTKANAVHDLSPPKVKPHEAEKPDPEEKPKEAEKPKPETPKKPPEEKKPEDKPKQDFPAVKVQNRIAALQHVEDKNQADNPNAEFIGDDANHVREQTQARITATDQNDPNPTPGSAHDGPNDEPGNAHVTDIAHSEDAPGAIDHAPNEHAAGQRVAASVEHTTPGASRSIREVAPDSHKGIATGVAKGSQKSSDQTKKQDERLEVAGSRATPESPDMMTSRGGSEVVNEAAEGRIARESEQARPKRLPPVQGQPGALDFLGLGASGTTPGGINLNLTPGAALAAVGHDQLGRERLADGERRRSRHRGSWKTLGIERWRASIENYNSSVKPGNQTALNTARVPFATYLNQIHNRLHPIFADSFLGSLEGLPSDNPLNKPDMRTNLEIILDKDEGKIVKMGITRSSGSTIFDVAALESVQNAAPFGKPPAVIVSPDGNVYLHWEFYRNPYYACSTYFAHPFLLKAAPETAPPHLAPPPSPGTPSFGPHEQPVPSRGDL
ncbi:MAG TPA: TonB C-terminal domain-containing protein, partial [Polyangiaceae bacterium]